MTPRVRVTQRVRAMVRVTQRVRVNISFHMCIIKKPTKYGKTCVLW